MLIVSTDFNVDYPHPITPATKVVEALMPHAPLELPREIDDFDTMQWNGNSDFIFVSFSTLVSKEMNYIIDL